jgi:hypothetical protein
MNSARPETMLSGVPTSWARLAGKLAGHGYGGRPSQIVLERHRALRLDHEPIGHLVERLGHASQLVGPVDRQRRPRLASPQILDAFGQARERTDDLALQRQRGQADDDDQQESQSNHDVDDRLADLAVGGRGQPDDLERPLDSVATTHGDDVREVGARAPALVGALAGARRHHALQHVDRHRIPERQRADHVRRQALPVEQPDPVDRVLPIDHLREQAAHVECLAVSQRVLDGDLNGGGRHAEALRLLLPDLARLLPDTHGAMGADGNHRRQRDDEDETRAQAHAQTLSGLTGCARRAAHSSVMRAFTASTSSGVTLSP